jgi:ribonuclease P protein subunit POP4
MHRRDMPRQELIGLESEVVDATNEALKGIKGIIVDETKNTLTIEQENKRKIVLKEQVTLDIKVDGRTVRIDGKMLLGRPGDRIKK